jgi:hypothetical protein
MNFEADKPHSNWEEGDKITIVNWWYAFIPVTRKRM